jgi:hypothetical protein
LGPYPQFKASSIWQANAVPKCQFFAWLAALGKAPMTDNLAKKTGRVTPYVHFAFVSWKQVTICSRHATSPRQSGTGLLKASIFTRQYSLFKKETLVTGYAPSIVREPKKQQLKTVGIMFFFWWEIWKERNRCIFNQEEHSFLQVFKFVKEAIANFRRAFPEL